MNAQLTLFDQAFQTSTTVNHSCKIIQFPGIAEPPKKTNYRKGEEQTVSRLRTAISWMLWLLGFGPMLTGSIFWASSLASTWD